MTRAAAVLLALMLCTAPTRGYAESPTAPDPGALYRQGREAFDAGRLQDALAAFTRAHALSGLPELLINMAQSERGLGRTQEAVGLFERFIAEAPDHRLRPAAERTLEELRAVPATSPSVPDAPTNFHAEPTPQLDQTAPSQAVSAQGLTTAHGSTAPENTWLWVGIGVGAALIAGGAITWAATRSPQLPTLGTLELPPP